MKLEIIIGENLSIGNLDKNQHAINLPKLVDKMRKCEIDPAGI